MTAINIELIIKYIGLVGGLLGIVASILSWREIREKKVKRIRNFISSGFDVKILRQLRFYVIPSLEIDNHNEGKIHLNPNKTDLIKLITSELTQKIIFLISDAGMGKSMLLAYLLRNETKLIYNPKLIRLSINEISQINSINEKNGVILMIDSIDELMSIDIKTLLLDDYSKLNSFGKVIIALRINRFNDLLLSNDFLHKVSIIQILPFSNREFYKYLFRRYFLKINRIIQARKTIRNNINLFKIPLFLNYVHNLKGFKTDLESKYSVYETIVKQHFSKIISIDGNISVEILFTLFEEIAYEMYKNKKNSIAKSILYQNISISNLDKNLIVEKFLNESHDEFEFIHYSFFEFFIARKFHNNPKLFNDAVNFLSQNENILNFIFERDIIKIIQCFNGRYVTKDNLYVSYEIRKDLGSITISEIQRLFIRYNNEDFQEIINLAILKNIDEITLFHQEYSPSLYKIAAILFLKKDLEIFNLTNGLKTEVQTYIDKNLVNGFADIIHAIKNTYSSKYLSRLKTIYAFTLSELYYTFQQNEIIIPNMYKSREKKCENLLNKDLTITNEDIQNTNKFITNCLTIENIFKSRDINLKII